MSGKDRRFGFRVPVEFFLDKYVGDRRFRVLAQNLSETGIRVSRAGRLPSGTRSVAMEIALPGDGESIWARGEIRVNEAGELCEDSGIKFTAMAKSHARKLRDFCVERRKSHLGHLLSAIAR